MIGATLSQRHQHGAAVVGCVALVISLAIADGGARPSADSKTSVQRVRTVGRVRDQPLNRLLLPTDEILEVLDQQPYGLAPPPPPPGYPGHGKPEIQRRIDQSSLVALIKVKWQEGQLTVAGDWVRSIVRAEVVHLYKALPSTNVATGDEVTLTAPGGEVQIGHQWIRARHKQAMLLEDGRTYLVFGLPLSWSWTREPGDPDDWVRAGECLLDAGDLFVSVWTGARQAKMSLLTELEAHSRP